MKRRTLMLSILTVLLVLILSVGVCYAATEIQNGEPFTPRADEVYCIKLNAQTDITFAADSGTVTFYTDESCTNSQGSNQPAFEDKLIKTHTFGAAYTTIGNNYFKFSGELSEATAVWEASDVMNNTLATAETVDIAMGETKNFNLDSQTGYYSLDLKESGKYTFTTSSINYAIWEGAQEASGEELYKCRDLSETYTTILPVGKYTIKAYVPGGGSGKLDIKRENWVGISEITCDSTLTGVYGKTVTYKVKYSPANADSQITIKEAKFGTRKEGMITKVSQADGVATFKIKLSKLYNKDDPVEWRQWAVKTEDSLEKIIEEKAGPKAATIEKKAIGYCYGGTITISNGTANKYAVQLKVNGKWKTIMKNIDGAPGSSWVDITFYDSTGKKLIKPGKQYTARIVSYADSVKGASKQFKFITAYNTKPTKLKATCVSCKFGKGKGNVWNPYKWAYDYSPDKSIATVKFTFKKAKNSQGTLIGDKIVTKSGKKIKYTIDGKIKKATTYTIVVRSVRKKNGMVAYGPTVNLKCKFKKAS